MSRFQFFTTAERPWHAIVRVPLGSVVIGPVLGDESPDQWNGVTRVRPDTVAHRPVLGEESPELWLSWVEVEIGPDLPARMAEVSPRDAISRLRLQRLEKFGRSSYVRLWPVCAVCLTVVPNEPRSFCGECGEEQLTFGRATQG